MKLPRGWTWRRVMKTQWPNMVAGAINLYIAYLPGSDVATFISCLCASLSITTTLYFLRALHRLAIIEEGQS